MKEKKILKVDDTKDKEYYLPCVKCDNETYHKVLSSVNKREEFNYMDYWHDYEIVSCMGCREISFRSNWTFSEDEEPDEEGNLVPIEHVELFPGRILGRKPLKDLKLLPKNILKIYKETYVVITNKAPILTGVGLRALVESICKEKKAKGTDLEKRIDDLISLKVLTEEGAEILHSTRIMGNNAVHELTASDEKDLDIAMNLIEHLLMGVYILPKKVSKLPKRKKKQVSRSSN